MIGRIKYIICPIMPAPYVTRAYCGVKTLQAYLTSVLRAQILGHVTI